MVDDALDALRRTGALKPRELPPSPVLRSTRDAIARLWGRCDDREAEALAADNLFLDAPASKIRDGMDKIKTDLGNCRPAGDVEAENLLRGTFRMSCDRGHADVSFTLAPTMPPRVQFLRFHTARILEEQAERTAESLASLVGSFRKRCLSQISGPGVDTEALRRQLAALRIAYGSCRLGETLGGDGATDVRVRFECDRGRLDVSFHLQEKGRLLGVSFSRPADVPCVP